MNTKSSYATCVVLVLLRNLGKSTRSIHQLSTYADKQMEKLHIKNTLSESTKYLVIKELISTGILLSKNNEGMLSITLSPDVISYFKGEGDYEAVD